MDFLLQFFVNMLNLNKGVNFGGISMNLKKGLSILLCFILMFSIVGCNKFEDNNMTIEKAKLSKDEKNIFELTKVNTYVEIWDYDVDETIKSISLNCYELDENNKWQAISGGGSLLAEAKQGRISLAFDKIPDGIKISIQEKNGTIFSSHELKIQWILAICLI